MNRVIQSQMQEQADFERARDVWWENQPTRGKKAIVKKAQRTLETQRDNLIRRAVERQQQDAPYVCPKCHARHPTPEARAACRRSHD